MEAAVRAAAALACCLWLIATAGAALADGLLPPKPYRYLHPPPALARGNQLPQSGERVDRVVRGHSVTGYTFTKDGQAGILYGDRAFAVPPSATGVRITVRPVETAPGLPQPLAADGNAYEVRATVQPGGSPARLARPVVLVVRWPRLPTAIYRYVGGQWRRLCYSDQATITPSTFSCPTRALGTFVAAHVSSGTTTTPTSSSRFAWVSRYWLLLVALAVVVVAAILGAFMYRPGAKPRV